MENGILKAVEIESIRDDLRSMPNRKKLEEVKLNAWKRFVKEPLTYK